MAGLLQAAYDRDGLTIYEAKAFAPGYQEQSLRNLLRREGMKYEDQKWIVTPGIASTLQPKNRPTVVQPREVKPFKEYIPPVVQRREALREISFIATGTSKPYREL